jgi:hypothetical protein
MLLYELLPLRMPRWQNILAGRTERKHNLKYNFLIIGEYCKKSDDNFVANIFFFNRLWGKKVISIRTLHK